VYNKYAQCFVTINKKFFKQELFDLFFILLVLQSPQRLTNNIKYIEKKNNKFTFVTTNKKKKEF